MMRLLHVLFPAIFCLLPQLFGKKNEKTFFNYLKTYCSGVIFVNMTILFILLGFTGLEVTALGNTAFTPSFGLKYIGLGIVLAIFYGLLFTCNVTMVKHEMVKKSPGWWSAAGTVLAGAGIFLIFLLIIGTQWLVNTFGLLDLNKLMFTMKSPLVGTSMGMIISFVAKVLVWVAICTGLSLFVLHVVKYNKIVAIGFAFKNMKAAIKLGWLTYKRMMIAIPVVLIVSLGYAVSSLGIYDDVSYMLKSSTFIEDNYVDPKTTKLTFPEQKRNLIYIFLESMENTYTSVEQGGMKQVDVIPELTALANTNTSFSNTDKSGGTYQAPGASWTIAAMLAHTAGIPLNTSVDGNEYGQMTEAFVPGAYAIGDILEEQGYNQYLMVGSEGAFGGRSYYFQQHGDYQVYDYNIAVADGVIPEGYYVWWGMEDMYLFDYAKQTIADIAQYDEPFNFTMLTVDTHHIGGYVCELCDDTYEAQFDNVLACASKQVADFVSWIQEQDFYENTSIVIVGDHLSMDAEYFLTIPDDYVRTTYNTFINGAVDTNNIKNREISSFDFYPTTLASMGVEIEGDRLGLGTNLFSETPTLLEELGKDYVFDQLAQSSPYYNEKILHE